MSTNESLGRSNVPSLAGVHVENAPSVRGRRGSPLELFGSADDGNQYDGEATSITANVDLWPRPIVLFGNAGARPCERGLILVRCTCTS